MSILKFLEGPENLVFLINFRLPGAFTSIFLLQFWVLYHFNFLCLNHYLRSFRFEWWYFLNIFCLFLLNKRWNSSMLPLSNRYIMNVNVISRRKKLRRLLTHPCVWELLHIILNRVRSLQDVLFHLLVIPCFHQYSYLVLGEWLVVRVKSTLWEVRCLIILIIRAVRSTLILIVIYLISNEQTRSARIDSVTTPPMYLMILHPRIHLKYLLKRTTFLPFPFLLWYFSEVPPGTYHDARGQRITVSSRLNGQLFIILHGEMILNVFIDSVQLALTHFQSLELDREGRGMRFGLIGLHR